MGALAILQAIEGGKIKGLYLAGENPVVTYPDSARTKKALASLDFLVVQDCFLTETASLAHVVLPAATFAEKEGTFTNVDRRVQRVRPALRPQGEARPDLAIFQSLAQEMGANLGPSTAKEVNDEIRNLVPCTGESPMPAWTPRMSGGNSVALPFHRSSGNTRPLREGIPPGQGPIDFHGI